MTGVRHGPAEEIIIVTQDVKECIEERCRRCVGAKSGSLKSGSGKNVTSNKQAIAIGLSEARKKGKKVGRKSS